MAAFDSFYGTRKNQTFWGNSGPARRQGAPAGSLPRQMIWVVLDSNIYVSALVFGGNPRVILELDGTRAV
jgi:hypothetical protein